MKYLVILCMLLSSCTNSGRFISTPKIGECWYLYELAPSNGAKIIEVGEYQISYKYIHKKIGVFGEIQVSPISYFEMLFEFKRDCPK